MTRSGRHEHRNEERHVGGSDNRRIDPGQLIRRRFWKAALRAVHPAGSSVDPTVRAACCQFSPRDATAKLIAHLNGFILE